MYVQRGWPRMHTIILKGLRVPCLIGRTGDENTAEQLVLLDIELTYDAHPATTQDVWPAPVCYDAVAAAASDLLRAGRFALLETAAQRLAERLASRTEALRVSVTASKPSAVPHAALAAVRYEVAK